MVYAFVALERQKKLLLVNFNGTLLIKGTAIFIKKQCIKPSTIRHSLLYGGKPSLNTKLWGFVGEVHCIQIVKISYAALEKISWIFLIDYRMWHLIWAFCSVKPKSNLEYKNIHSYPYIILSTIYYKVKYIEMFKLVLVILSCSIWIKSKKQQHLKINNKLKLTCTIWMKIVKQLHLEIKQ